MARHDEAPTDTAYPAQKARQGEIILRTRTRRLIFIAGLVGMVVVAVAVRLFLWHHG